MKRSVLFVLVVAALGCGKKKPEATPSAGSAGSAASTVTPAATADASAGSADPGPGSAGSATAAAAGSGSGATSAGTLPTDGENLLGLAQGALIVDEPEGVDNSVQAWRLLDGDPGSDWGVEKDVILKHPFVIELADRAEIDTFVVDAASIELPDRLPGKIKIEVSDKSATDGFVTLAELEPKQPAADGMRFPVAKPVPGRWLRVTFFDAIAEDTTQQDIANLRGYGKRLTHDASPNITGTYQTNQGIIHLKQTGSLVTGCREEAAQPILGGMDGRVLNFYWPVTDDGFEGPAFGVFGKTTSFMGYWPTKLETPGVSHVELTKKLSDKPGTCPQDKKDPIATGLETGRVRLYGILFDTDSDKLKDLSKGTLDAVVKVLKDHADWKITIEGHTDSTSTHLHNQTLSEKRAAAVKAYLTTAGIDAGRLDTAGLAETKPVAPNTSEVGRASNRRVELVKR